MQISLIVPNIWNPDRDTAEILKIHELGTRLLSNHNKYGYCLLLSSTEYSKVGTVGAFLAYKICFAPISPILHQIFQFYCMLYTTCINMWTKKLGFCKINKNTY